MRSSFLNLDQLSLSLQELTRQTSEELDMVVRALVSDLRDVQMLIG